MIEQSTVACDDPFTIHTKHYIVLKSSLILIINSKGSTGLYRYTLVMYVLFQN